MSLHPIITQSSKSYERYEEALFLIRLNGADVQHFTLAESSSDALKTFCTHYGYKPDTCKSTPDTCKSTPDTLKGMVQTGKGSVGIQIHRLKYSLSALNDMSL